MVWCALAPLHFIMVLGAPGPPAGSQQDYKLMGLHHQPCWLLDEVFRQGPDHVTVILQGHCDCDSLAAKRRCSVQYIAGTT